MQICGISPMTVDVGHNRPIVLQICVLPPLRKHPKTSPIGILLYFSYDSIYFAEVFGKSTGLENIRISQMHSWILGALGNRDYFYRKRGEICKNTTHFLATFFAWNNCKIFDASQVDTRRKSEESREILIGWKRDRLRGTHRSITYIFHASLSRGNISLSQTPQRSLSSW